MVSIEHLARVALAGDALELRSLSQEWVRENQPFVSIPFPQVNDPDILAVAASLLEMFAERAGQAAPRWTQDVPPAARPIFLLREARTMPRLHKLCEDSAPAALRRRHVYAPPNFLEFA
ncbi:MAG TPA: hypothetical protein VFE47_27960 [Tepidisphaeraceae bacterium]|jgi:hypothetical protein|nr:hypothetical protein [Tepidisphaeraceae bacterium]